MNAKHYTYRVIWSEEDGEFVGLCSEFPSLSWLDAEQSAALAGMVSLVEQTVADKVYRNILYETAKVSAMRLAMSTPMVRLLFSISETWC